MACLLHKWNGCKCRKCGKIRNTGHIYEGCKCKICGTVRDSDHKWKGCHCTICGKFRIINNIKEVKRITDQAELISIGNQLAHSYEVRKAAKDRLTHLQANKILKITDNIKLITAINEEKDYSVRSFVVEKLTNQDILADIAENDESDIVRIKAAGRLTDKSLSQNMYASIVKDEKADKTWRREAYDKITDQNVLQVISNVPFVKELLLDREGAEYIANIEKKYHQRIRNCKNHEWECYEGGYYLERRCKKCGASETTYY